MDNKLIKTKDEDEYCEICAEELTYNMRIKCLGCECILCSNCITDLITLLMVPGGDTTDITDGLKCPCGHGNHLFGYVDKISDYCEAFNKDLAIKFLTYMQEKYKDKIRT